jgi:hypothetical protein
MCLDKELAIVALVKDLKDKTGRCPVYKIKAFLGDDIDPIILKLRKEGKILVSALQETHKFTEAQRKASYSGIDGGRYFYLQLP